MHGEGQTFVLCGHSQPRVPLRLQEAVRGGAPPCWLQQDKAGFLPCSRSWGPRRGLWLYPLYPPQMGFWAIATLGPLEPANPVRVPQLQER